MPHSIQDIITGLETARQKSPELAGVINLHCALLRAQAQAAPPAISALPTANQVEQALHTEAPLLHLVDFAFDPQETARLAAEICRIMAEHRPDLAESLEPIRRLLSQNGQMRQAVSQYLNGGKPNTPLPLTPSRREEKIEGGLLSKGHPADPSLLTFVLNQTLRPFLQTAIRSLKPLIPNPKPVLSGAQRAQVEVSKTQNLKSTCPMCGGPPDFAALISEKQDDEHGRQLLCARCDTEWGYKRSGCPFCEATGQWAYFPDDNEVFRLYVCDACRHYLKTVDWRQTFAHRLLPVERVLTVNMDVAAAGAGYIS